MSAALAETTGARLVIEGPALASWLGPRLADGDASREDARVVVCVCDPLLYVRKCAGMSQAPARESVLQWCDEQDALVRAALSSGRPVLVVRYEDLADRMEETLARVCSFAGLDYELPMRAWWTSVMHAIGAKSENWGTDEPLRMDRVRAAQGVPHRRRIDAFSDWDHKPALHVGADVARMVIAEVMPTGLYETFGYEPELPPYRAPADDAERMETAAWVQQVLHRTRDAVLADRADAAIATLRMLADHFGPAFDELGLELKYEDMAIVLVDLLNNQQRYDEALPYARELVGHAPFNVVARQMLAVAMAGAGESPAAVAATERCCA